MGLINKNLIQCTWLLTVSKFLIDIEDTDFFQASLFQLLKLEIHCEDHISPSYISAVHI